jgi:hypothetical protein
MKFALVKEHLSFFRYHRAIEFQGLLTELQTTELRQSIEKVLKTRIQSSLEKLDIRSPEQKFLAGRDLWRSNALIKQRITQGNFACIAGELMEKKSLRLAYDQLFPNLAHHSHFQREGESYSSLMQGVRTIGEISSIEPIVCGCMISLGGTSEKLKVYSQVDSPETNSFEPPLHIFPSSGGNALFFHPSFPIDFSQISHFPGVDYILIAYTTLTGSYHFNPIDPNTYSLKSLGYVFGDRLNERWNPVLYRGIG